jgi:dienelactone hydrolase
MRSRVPIEFSKGLIALSLLCPLIACASMPGIGGRSDPVTELSQGQTGRIYFESTNPASYRNVMTRHLDTRKTVIWGTLTVPQSPGKVPAVIILCHAGGIQESHEFVWARELNKIGLATFVVDHVAARKLRRYDDQRQEIHTPTFIADAFAALNLLSTHPAIDPNKIAVIGYSKSGQAAHLTASTVIQTRLAKPGLRFAAHVGVYPVCSFTLHHIGVTGAPLLFLVGEKDNKCLPELCERYAERIRRAGFEAKVIVYPDAYWGWDRKGFKRTIQAVNTADCYVEFLDDSRMADPGTGRPLTGDEVDALMRKCLKQGYTAAYNAEVTRRSMEDAKAFLSKVLLNR